MDQARQQYFDVKKLKEPRAKNTSSLQLKNKFQTLADAEKYTTYTRQERQRHHLGADRSSLYTDQRSLPGTQTKEEEEVDHRRYLASHREQESGPEEESHGHQVRLAEREI